MKHIVFALLLGATPALIPGPAPAQCNLRSRTVYQSYGYQAPTYYAPTYHQEEYYHKKDHYYEKVVLVPKAIQVEVQRNHYYSIDSYAQQNLLADAVVGRLLRLQADKVQTPAPAQQLAPAPPPRAPEIVMPPADQGEPVAGAYQDPEMLAILNESCVKCHSSNSKYTRFVTKDGKIADVKAGKVWEAFAKVNSGNMPKGGKSLSDDKVKKFYAWGEVARQ